MPLSEEAKRGERCRAGAVLVWNNRKAEVANLAEIKALFKVDPERATVGAAS